jgi:hypothetical protein
VYTHKKSDGWRIIEEEKERMLQKWWVNIGGTFDGAYQVWTTFAL